MITSKRTSELDRDTPIPLYFQVSSILRREIESGKYQAGDYIPTEAELQKRFGISRHTVRQAISDLVYKGLLERRRSKGTLVCASQLEVKLSDLASFTQEMMNSGLELMTKIIDFHYMTVPDDVAPLLKVTIGEKVAFMERLRFVDQKPVAIEKWYTPLRFVPGIKKSLFGEQGVEQSTYYMMMKHYGIVVTHAVDTISPVPIEAREARLLNVPTGQPGLLRTRISFTADDQPISYGIGVYLIRLRFFQDAGR